MFVYRKTLAGSSSTVSYTFGKLARLFRQVVHFLSLPPPPLFGQKMARAGTHDSIG